MSGCDRTQDAFPREDPCLAAYREAVERLRHETIAELGRQPMPPEQAAMLAVVLTSLAMIVTLHPSAPFTLQVWQVALVEIAVWVGVFRLQCRRYERFQARWHGKLAAHRAAEAAAEALQRRSGQTTGAWAAANRLVVVASPRSITSTISSLPTTATSPRIERPSSSHTSVEPSIQRQGARR
jgi:hypothetical protein